MRGAPSPRDPARLPPFYGAKQLADGKVFLSAASSATDAAPTVPTRRQHDAAQAGYAASGVPDPVGGAEAQGGEMQNSVELSLPSL